MVIAGESREDAEVQAIGCLHGTMRSGQSQMEIGIEPRSQNDTLRGGFMRCLSFVVFGEDVPQLTQNQNAEIESVQFLGIG